MMTGVPSFQRHNLVNIRFIYITSSPEQDVMLWSTIRTVPKNTAFTL